MNKYVKIMNENKDDEKQREILRIAQSINEKKFKKNFPHLYEEYTGKTSFIPVDQVLGQKLEIDEDEGELDPLKGYNPDIFDFMARAKTDEEAIEIIAFLEIRKEISKEQATELKEKVIQDGVRSVVDRRYHDHYIRKAQSIAKTRSILRAKELRKID